jgi:NAD(P)-dependent dehydrogenase (short-subunit alcohol dehydrogenase family)
LRQGCAVITGGCGEIGQAIAKQISQLHRVFVFDIAAPSKTLGLEFDACNITYLRVDVTDPQAVRGAFDKVAQYGPIAFLACVAGGSTVSRLCETNMRDWETDISLNLNSAFHCGQVAVSHMLNTNTAGTIINISSVNGPSTFGHPSYSVAKAGLVHLTRFQAIEYGKHAIRAVAVAPGTVLTKAWETRIKNNPNLENELLAVYPGLELPTPDDIANLVTFLASPGASKITGCCIPIDSGLTAGSIPMNEIFTQEKIIEPTL